MVPLSPLWGLIPKSAILGRIIPKSSRNDFIIVATFDRISFVVIASLTLDTAIWSVRRPTRKRSATINIKASASSSFAK